MAEQEGITAFTAKQDKVVREVGRSIPCMLCIGMKDNRYVHDRVMEPLESLVRFRLASKQAICIQPFMKNGVKYPGLRRASFSSKLLPTVGIVLPSQFYVDVAMRNKSTHTHTVDLLVL